MSYQSFPKLVYLETLIARLKNLGAEYFVRIILDTASSKASISKFVAEKLHLKSFRRLLIHYLIIKLFGGSKTTVPHNRYFIHLLRLNKNETMKIEFSELQKICATIPRITDISCTNQLKGKPIILSDVCSKSNDCLHEYDRNGFYILLEIDVLREDVIKSFLRFSRDAD